MLLSISVSLLHTVLLSFTNIIYLFTIGSPLYYISFSILSLASRPPLPFRCTPLLIMIDFIRLTADIVSQGLLVAILLITTYFLFGQHVHVTV